MDDCSIKIRWGGLFNLVVVRVMVIIRGIKSILIEIVLKVILMLFYELSCCSCMFINIRESMIID